MRPILLALASLLLLSTAPPSAADDTPLASGYTAPDAPFRAGMWWNPDRSGAGMDIHLSGDRLFLVWYTYEADGLPVWYMAEGEWTGETWTAPLQRFTWDGASASGTDVGEATLTFHGPADATFDWALGEDSGSQAIEPLLVNEGISVYDRTGHWYPPGEPGYGLTVNQQGSVEFVVAYLYDAAGEPRWLWSDRTGELTSTHELVMFQGACPTCAYEEPVPTAAGSLTRSFAGPRRGNLRLEADFPAPASGEWRRPLHEINILSNPQDGRTHPAAMAPFADAAALEAYLKRALAERSPRDDSGIDFSPAPAAPSYSLTTVQEAGVDEADTIKTDGDILYAIHPGQEDRGIRVLDIDPATGNVNELARLTGEMEFLDVRDMYLVAGEGEAEKDLLVGLFYREIVGDFGPPWYDNFDWMNRQVEVRVWDVSNPASPSVAWTLGLDGGMVESRRIGNKLYLVTRHTPMPPPGVNAHATSEEAIAANLEVLESVSLADLLPDVRLDGERIGELVTPGNTWLPPVILDRETPSLISISSVDLRAPEPAVETMTLAGQSEAIYVSQDNIYLASTRYDYLQDINQLIPDYPRLVFTDIHKLALLDGGPEYRGSATVEGHLGFRQQRKQFRMGEFQGHLGVVSSSEDMWGDLGDHRLTVLEETPRTPEHRLLREVAHLPNPERPRTLGKPNEDLYATRFLGDRLYAVTFKKVDPLYVVDISRPSRPVIRGEVEVFGYSDFLYPVGQDLLLGVGKDAAPAEGPGDGRFAWYQGLRLGLFDVSDADNPVELDNVILGRRGTDSPALSLHHAFSFLPASESRPARFAIPVRRHDTVPGQGISPDPTFFYPWVETGLYLFSVTGADTQSARLRQDGGVFTAWYPTHDDSDPRSWLTPDLARSVITDDSVFFVKQGEVWSAPWNAPDQAVGPQ